MKQCQFVHDRPPCKQRHQNDDDDDDDDDNENINKKGKERNSK